MADDIDIEEHDLLDNPVIKSIFPDLSLLKKEIQSYYDDASDVKNEPISSTCVSEPMSGFADRLRSDTDPHHTPEDVNRSRRSTNAVYKDYSEEPAKGTATLELPIHSNKIILGSKPNKPLEFEEFFERQLNVPDPKIIVDDLGPYLKRSCRYCVDCMILFPKREELDAHNKKTHFHVISRKIEKKISVKNKSVTKYHSKQIECHICRNYFSTHGNLTKHYKNVHAGYMELNKMNKIITTVQNKMKIEEIRSGTSNTCVHCKKSFSSQQSLIDHIYNILQSKEISCKKCSQVFSNKEILIEHMKLLHHNHNNFKNKGVKVNEVKSKRIEILRKKCPQKCSNKKKVIQRIMKGVHQKYNKTENKGHTYNINISKNKRLTSGEIEISCKKCSQKFSNNENLLEHVKLVHQKHNKIENQDKEVKLYKVENNPSVKSTEILYYRCFLCSHYFKTQEFCMAHQVKKHNVTKHPKMVAFSFDSKCKYCSQKCKNISVYNAHLKQAHSLHYTANQKKINEHNDCTFKTDEQQPDDKPELKSNNKSELEYEKLVLKSTLFKCSKCDIHFLTAKTALNHSDHMEKLINWKCSICHRIFKKTDEIFHEKQHWFSHKFDVKELSPSELTRLLYKCTKCAIHFKEHNFLKHCQRCGRDAPSSVYCKICDILIDYSIEKSHKVSHQYKNFKSCDFTIIDSDIIITNKKIFAGHNTPLKKSTTLKRKSREKTAINGSKRKKFGPEYMFKVTYCKTCKCFLTDCHKRRVHLQSQCVNLIKYVCKLCGLVLTAKGYQTHKILHKTIKNLKLQDFIFYEMESGKQIYPPMPEFPKCNNCEVYFVSKAVVTNIHECINEDYLTCHVCQLKLSEGAFKLHMLFHNYSNSNLKKVILEDNDSTSVLTAGGTNLETNSTVKTDVGKATENFKYDSSFSAVLFICITCQVTVNTYDKAVEHCQRHYCHEQMLINTEKCNLCHFNLDSTCYESHKKMHMSKNISFQVFKFDILYFLSENDVWIKHVFGSLSQEEIDKIVGKSIYKFECRMKMKVVQDGPTDLTVFKCDKCNCFISNSLIYRHAENSCFKLKKHTCSYCGLAFNSSMARVEHEGVHKIANIGLKSFRIVVFNREEDKSFNSLMFSKKNYVLYQCRNCNGVVDKWQVDNHKCNKNCLCKCSKCGLLFSRDEYNIHDLRHKHLVRFTKDHMKVILFGEKTEISQDNTNALVSSFTGNICDYSFYQCTKCSTCEKTVQRKLKHTCSYGTTRTKCPICDLYFLNTKYKTHQKLHDNDQDVLRESINIVSFDPIHSDSHSQEPAVEDTHNEVQCESENIEQSVKIYQCSCGLNYLEEPSLLTHFKTCNPKARVSKQKCSKCDLLFTPNILFDHLLLHHGNKKQIYTFDIFGITENKEDNL